MATYKCNTCGLTKNDTLLAQMDTNRQIHPPYFFIIPGRIILITTKLPNLTNEFKRNCFRRASGINS